MKNIDRQKQKNSKNKQCIVSAIVSAYNSEKFIRGCLEDIESQTIFDRLEIVVVDSGSEQKEQEIVREFQQRHDNILYVRTKERETIYAAWNRGIKAASGKYITNANTDDRHRNDAFERMVSILEAKNEISLVYADAYITIEENIKYNFAHAVSQFRWPDFDPRLLFRMCYVGPQPMWRRELHDRYGYFNPEYQSAGDYEFWLRIAAKEKFYHIPEVLGLYLLSPTGVERKNEMLSYHESEQARNHYWPANWGKRPQPIFIPAYSSLGEQQYESWSPLNYTANPQNKGSNIFSNVLNSGPEPEPMVTVIVPTRNRPHMLVVALNSIFTQTYKNIEIIVVNDGGEDISNTVAPFKKLGDITFISSSKRKGPAAARNTGLTKAKGKYITYLDDDDIYYPNHVETLVKFMESAGYKVAYSSSYQAFQEWDGKRFVTVSKKARGQDFDKQKLLIKDYIPILTIMHRKDCIDEVGQFDEELEVHEDWDLLIRLSQRFNFQHVNAVTAEFRTRNGTDSITSNNFTHFLDTFKKIHSRYSHYISDPKIEKAQKAIVNLHETKILQKEHVEISSINLSTADNDVINAKISIIITVRNGGDNFRRLLQSIRLQRKIHDVELIIIDENSGNGSEQAAIEFGAKVVSFPDGEYNQGKCLNLAISKLKGEYIIFTDQDAQPVSNYWIYNMIRPFVYYPEMDALTCKQFVRSEADLFSLWINAESVRSMYFASDSISVFTGNSNTVNWKLFDTEIKKRLTCFDNVSSCVRRNVVENLMFSDLSNTMNVNVDFGIRLLENSKKLGYLTSTGVYHLIPVPPERVLKKVYSETKALNILVNGMPNFFELNDINLERIKTDIIRVYNLIQVTIVELENIVENPITAVKNFICTIRNNLNHNPDKIVSDFKETEVSHDGGLGIFLRQMISGKYTAQEHELNSAKNIIFPDFMNRFLIFSEYLCCKHTTLYGRQDDFVSSIYKIFAITVGEIMGSYHIESITANNLTHELQEIDRLLKNDDRY